MNQDTQLSSISQNCDISDKNSQSISNQALNDPELSLDSVDKELQKYLDLHPEEKPIISTELHLILQKELKDFFKKEPLLSKPPIDPEKKSQLNYILDKILKITGFSKKKHQIPMRNLFDKSSSDLHIPFPILTRKTEDARLQWALIHWNKLEPYLISSFHPNSHFSYENAVINP